MFALPTSPNTTLGARWILDGNLEPDFKETDPKYKSQCHLNIWNYLQANQVQLDKRFKPNTNMIDSLSECLETEKKWPFSSVTSCLFVSTFQAYAASFTPEELSSRGIPAMARIAFRQVLKTSEPELYHKFQ
mgnify:CR=1 FL=1